MSEETVVTPRRSLLVDGATIFVLSITAVLTAWCGFEASKWGGEMSIAFSQASSARIQAAAAEGTARDARQYDLSIYTQWVLAEADGRDELREFIEERFTPEFRTAFDAWEAGGREQLGPMAMAEYVPPGTQEAVDLTARADAKFEEGLGLNETGDRYSLLTVLFALVLFLVALSQRNVVPWMKYVLLGLGVVIGVVCVGIMLTYPILI
ncbi:hypothetical protein MWU75_15710 [Ornithinimicrobium sp. F0845]|uniref:hypothetical protein n=1 Tax=Ornithinimicrobium sp. F0845 TaxID=2926412 RepID=UPI001FF1CD72|nr:hypothetical protein [Ornithinimicrobium sp. F0845]MCK0113592.1 hypothetical protein [Ornithinimicrobium sp. F0845]